jgi:hypothetical protein
MATYLSLVNAVLARLRESPVASVTTSSYSTLIGKFVNDSKRQVEDAWNWDALSTTISLNTVGGTSNYTMTGIGLSPRGVVVNNTTQANRVQNVPIQWIIDNQQLSPAQNGAPTGYAWNGSDGTDKKVELYPTPDGIYTIKFNCYKPQADLSADADILLIPSEAVEAGAYARAIVERGEDGGLSSGEAYGLYKGILADQISHEAGRFIEDECWVPN